MRIIIKATGLTLTTALRDYIERKIGSLKKFLSRLDLEGGVEAKVEVARTTKHHHKGIVFRAEVNLKVPRKLLRAHYENSDARVAIDRARHKLQREIEKYKAKATND